MIILSSLIELLTMGFPKGQSGNPNGRPKKIVESAQQNILAELFNAEAEKLVVLNMLAIASAPSKQAVAAATWLWDRKYGKVKEQIEQSGETRVIVEYVDTGGNNVSRGDDS